MSLIPCSCEQLLHSFQLIIRREAEEGIRGRGRPSMVGDGNGKGMWKYGKGMGNIRQSGSASSSDVQGQKLLPHCTVRSMAPTSSHRPWPCS